MSGMAYRWWGIRHSRQDAVFNCFSPRWISAFRLGHEFPGRTGEGENTVAGLAQTERGIFWKWHCLVAFWLQEKLRTMAAFPFHPKSPGPSILPVSSLHSSPESNTVMKKNAIREALTKGLNSAAQKLANWNHVYSEGLSRKDTMSPRWYLYQKCSAWIQSWANRWRGRGTSFF